MNDDEQITILMPLQENIPIIPYGAGNSVLGHWYESICPLCGIDTWVTDSMISKKARIACSKCGMQGKGADVEFTEDGQYKRR